MSGSAKAISDYIHASKYARYLPELKRRETYEETVARVENMHLDRFPALNKEITEAFNLVRAKRVLPSMRSMQFGGAAILQNHNRIFNCSFSLVDRLSVFSDALFLLLSGCGVGYSVQLQHVAKLPPVGTVDPQVVHLHTIEDSIEGWARALDVLIQDFFQYGATTRFDYSEIRLAGAPIRTSGGRAPGPAKLEVSLERIREVLMAAQGRPLRPIECHRILCHAADAVLSGGIRRSAMIALFSLEDTEMMRAKTRDWYVTDPWFSNANNSVVLKRDAVKEDQFKELFQATQQWGEPGFYFTESLDYGTNPCCEIGLNPVLVVDEEDKELLRRQGIDVTVGDTFTGWAFCNLCEINAARLTSLEDFVETAKAATLIGTLQATYTDMPFLGWVSEHLTKKDALLGIGMTGMLDAPEIACNPEFQSAVAAKIKTWNAELSEILKIRPAARTTCIKPSGTTSLALGVVGSGHHAHHARRYIRRVTADRLEPVFQAFRSANPHMCVEKPDGKWVIEFAVEAPPAAIIKDDIEAITFLELIKKTQQNWVLKGTRDLNRSPGLTHNVSSTVTVRPEEWEKVADYMWENRNMFTGVSFLAASGDKDYSFAPNEAVTTEADARRWDELRLNYTPVDYLGMEEDEDNTDLIGEIACAGGLCAV